MPHDAHPMGVLVSAMSTLSIFHPDANPALKVRISSSKIFLSFGFNRSKEINLYVNPSYRYFNSRQTLEIRCYSIMFFGTTCSPAS